VVSTKQFGAGSTIRCKWQRVYTKDRKLHICKQKGPLKMAAEKENLHLLFSPTRYRLTRRVLSGVGPVCGQMYGDGTCSWKLLCLQGNAYTSFAVNNVHQHSEGNGVEGPGVLDSRSMVQGSCRHTRRISSGTNEGLLSSWRGWLEWGRKNTCPAAGLLTTRDRRVSATCSCSGSCQCVAG
jgi:hypothetical protein